MSSPKRHERVAGEIHAVLADALRTRIKDPRVTPVSITGVRLSPDLSVAVVYYTPLGGAGDSRELESGLRAAGGFLRRELGQQLRLRHVPELQFRLDAGLDEAIRLTSLLSRMEEEDRARAEQRSAEEQGADDKGASTEGEES